MQIFRKSCFDTQIGQVTSDSDPEEIAGYQLGSG